MVAFLLGACVHKKVAKIKIIWYNMRINAGSTEEKRTWPTQ